MLGGGAIVCCCASFPGGHPHLPGCPAAWPDPGRCPAQLKVLWGPGWQKSSNEARGSHRLPGHAGDLLPKINTFKLIQSPKPTVQLGLPLLAARSDGLQAACPCQDVWHKEQSRGPLNALDGHQEALQRDRLIHRCVGHHIGAEFDLPTCRLQDQNLEEVGGHRHVVLANDLVLHVGLPISFCPVSRPRHVAFQDSQGACSDPMPPPPGSLP